MRHRHRQNTQQRIPTIDADNAQLGDSTDMSQMRVSEIFELPTVSTKPLPLFTDALTMVTIDSLNSGNMMLAFSLPGRLLFWL